MAETHPGGRISRVPPEHRGSHPGFVGKHLPSPQPSGKETVRLTLERIEKAPSIPPIEPRLPSVSDYFKGRELPTDVWVPEGIRYYESLDDIDPQSPREIAKAKTKKYELETRPYTALQVSPPEEGESENASFRFVGEKGLYVRVVKGYEETESNGQIERKPITRWIHFNEEGSNRRDVIYT